jgi:hypothetical protein
MVNVSRAEQFLSSFARASGMSQDGKNWLINAVDPFHDRQTKLEGYPDVCNSASVVQRIKQTYTIAAPSAIVAAQTNWDLQIVNTPMLNLCSLGGVNSATASGGSNTLKSNLLYPDGTSTSAGYGGITFFAGPANTTFDLSNLSTQTASNHGYIQSNPIPSAYLEGNCRAIATGFEVVNTTADLTRQGSVMTYRQATPDYETAGTFQITNGTAASSYAAVSGLVIPCPPVTAAQCMLLTGTRQWLAREGAYVASSLCSGNLGVQEDNFVQPILIQDQGSQTSVGAKIYTVFPANSNVTIGGGNNIQIPARQVWSKFDQCGCYFQGLSYNSTLTIQWIVDIERFPTEQQSDLIVIATPSPKYDPVALEAYALIMNDMPTGVMAKENGLGDWFMDAVGSVRDVIMPTVRKAAKGNPMMGALVSVHDLVTGKGKKGKAKNEKGGSGFVAPPSSMNDGKLPRANKQKWVKTGKKSNSAIKPVFKKGKAAIPANFGFNFGSKK